MDQPRTIVPFDLSRPPSVKNSAYIHKICAANELSFIDEDVVAPLYDVKGTLQKIYTQPPKGTRVKREITDKWKHFQLKKYISSQHSSRILLSFQQIEEIDHLTLPVSARKSKAWWYPRNNCNTIAEAWLSEGYILDELDLKNERVILRRKESGFSKWSIPKVLMSPLPDNARFELEVYAKYIIEKYGLWEK